ncbi:MAG: outer membrane protein assembly factor BamD [Candidatus Omnitrophota bacterium]
MIKIKHFIIFPLIAAVFLTAPAPASAFWIWTPESGRWINPKYAVKPSPAEQLVYADEFFQIKKYQDAMREYKKLLQHYPKAREAALAQFGVASVWEAMKKYWRAVGEYQKVVDRYPFSDLGPKVVERQYVIVNLFLEGQARDQEFARSLFGTDYQIPEVFQKIIKNDPYGPNAPASQYKIGLFYLAKADYQQARDAFEKTISDYPDSKWAESARYQIAVADSKRSVGAQYDQKTTSIAVSGFEDYVKMNPDSELSPAAKAEVQKLTEKEAENNFVIGEFYAKHKKFKSARLYWQAVVDKYAATSWAGKAAAKLNALPGDAP